MPLRDLKPALNRFTIQFEDTVFAVINRHLHKIWDTIRTDFVYNFTVTENTTFQTTYQRNSFLSLELEHLVVFESNQ